MFQWVRRAWARLKANRFVRAAWAAIDDTLDRLSLLMPDMLQQRLRVYLYGAFGWIGLDGVYGSVAAIFGEEGRGLADDLLQATAGLLAYILTLLWMEAWNRRRQKALAELEAKAKVPTPADAEAAGA